MFQKSKKNTLLNTIFDNDSLLKYYLDLSLDILCIIDLDGKIVYTNQSFHNTTNYESIDVFEKQFTHFVSPKDQSKLVSILSKLKEDKEAVSLISNRFVTKDGNEKWFSWNIVYDKKHDLIFLSARDITLMHDNQEQLRFFSTAFDKAKDAILIAKNIGTLDNPNPSIVYVNQTFIDYSGYQIEDIIGQNPRIMRGKNKNAVTQKKMKQALKNWESIDVEVKNQTKTGEDIWVSLSISPIANDEGVFTHWISIQKDITTRVLKEQQLKMFESIVTNSQESVIITAAEPIDYPKGPKIVYVNDAFCELTGYTKAEAIGNTPGILQGELTSVEAKNNIKKSLENWQPIQQDVLNYKKNGESFWIDLSIVPVADKNGWFTHWISIQRDITERVKLQEALEKDVLKRTKELERSNQKLETFASVASHDLKAPLRMINSYLTLLRKRLFKKLGDVAMNSTYKEEMEYLNFAQQGTKNAYDLVQGILEYSQIKSEEDTWKIIDLNKKVDNITLLLKKDISLAAATINYNNLPKVKGNKTQLQQLFQNLISNALKFRGDNPCEINISCERSKDGYLFSVQDNGIGIKAGDENIIFNLFSRGKTNKKFEGQGIGLSLCKEIVKNHSGNIWVESTVDKGSTFYFTINT